jgi:hypothetical protein
MKESDFQMYFRSNVNGVDFISASLWRLASRIAPEREIRKTIDREYTLSKAMKETPNS